MQLQKTALELYKHLCFSNYIVIQKCTEFNTNIFVLQQHTIASISLDTELNPFCKIKLLVQHLKNTFISLLLKNTFIHSNGICVRCDILYVEYEANVQFAHRSVSIGYLSKIYDRLYIGPTRYI